MFGGGVSKIYGMPVRKICEIVEMCMLFSFINLNFFKVESMPGTNTVTGSISFMPFLVPIYGTCPERNVLCLNV